MVETVEVLDSRTGETVRCYYVDDAMEVAGVCRRTLERHTKKGELARLKHRGRTVHPVEEVEQIEASRFGARPGGATPPPKPRPNPRGVPR
jgi:hypothetical protein